MFYAVNSNGEVLKHKIRLIERDFRKWNLDSLKKKLKPPYIIEFGLPSLTRYGFEQYYKVLTDFFHNEKETVDYLIYEVHNTYENFEFYEMLNRDLPIRILSSQKFDFDTPYQMTYCDPYIWSEDVRYTSKNKHPSHLNDKIKYKFLCLNNKDKAERHAIASHIVSNPEIHKQTRLSYRETINVNFKSQYAELIDPKSVDFLNTNPSFGHDMSLVYKNIFCKINTETMFDEYPNFSEKTLDCFYWTKPFVMVGPYQTMTLLKELGFKTFDQWWSEDYDNVKDNLSRLKEIIKVVDYIQSKSITELRDIHEEMKPTLLHNFKHLRKITKIYNQIYLDSRT